MLRKFYLSGEFDTELLVLLFVLDAFGPVELSFVSYVDDGMLLHGILTPFNVAFTSRFIFYYIYFKIYTSFLACTL